MFVYVTVSFVQDISVISKTDNCLYLNKFPLNHFVMKPVSIIFLIHVAFLHCYSQESLKQALTFRHLSSSSLGYS